MKQQEKKLRGSSVPRLILLVNLLIAGIVFLGLVFLRGIDVFTAFFRSFLLFTLLSFLSTLILWIVVSIAVRVRQQKFQEEMAKLEERQRQLWETQFQIQQELESLDEQRWKPKQQQKAPSGK